MTTAYILRDYSPTYGYSTWLLVRRAWRQHVSQEQAVAAYRERFGCAPMAVRQEAGGWWCGPVPQDERKGEKKCSSCWPSWSWL